MGYRTPAEFAAAVEFGGREETTGKPEELKSVFTLSQKLVQKTGAGHRENRW